MNSRDQAQLLERILEWVRAQAGIRRVALVAACQPIKDSWDAGERKNSTQMNADFQDYADKCGKLLS